MFIADGATGEPRTSVELDTYYGSATDVARSADGRWLAVSVSGGDSFAYDFESGHTFQSITTYRDWQYETSRDPVRLPLNVNDQIFDKQTDTWSHLSVGTRKQS